MWTVQSTQITHIISYSKADVLPLTRGLVKSTQTDTHPHIVDRDCYSTDKQAEDNHRETRHRVGRASSLQISVLYLLNPTDVWFCILC